MKDDQTVLMHGLWLTLKFFDKMMTDFSKSGDLSKKNQFDLTIVQVNETLIAISRVMDIYRNAMDKPENVIEASHIFKGDKNEL